MNLTYISTYFLESSKFKCVKINPLHHVLDLILNLEAFCTAVHYISVHYSREYYHLYSLEPVHVLAQDLLLCDLL